MRITIATGPWLPVPALLGGAVPRLWQGLAEEFVRRGHEVCILARAFQGQLAEEVQNGVRYKRWGGFNQGLSIRRDLAKDFIYASLAAGRLPHADILITNTFWLPVIAGIFCKSAGKIVINANRFPKGQYRLYTKAARVAAASNAIRDAIMMQTPPLSSRTKVFPNPVDTSLLTPPARVRGANMPKKLLFVGRLHPEKGVHLLIEAFGRISNHHRGWRLCLVGPTSENQGGGGHTYEQRLRDLAQGLPVDFTGPVFDVEALAEIYRSADLFCYPSLAERGEALPVAPLEAMATGLPPVVSNLACFQDYIRDGETGVYFNHNVNDPTHQLANKLEQVISNWKLTLAMGEGAAKLAQRFSYTQVAKSYLADFEELLNGEHE